MERGPISLRSMTVTDIRFELWKWAEQKDWRGARPYWFWRAMNKLLVKNGYGTRSLAETCLKKPR